MSRKFWGRPLGVIGFVLLFIILSFRILFYTLSYSDEYHPKGNQQTPTQVIYQGYMEIISKLEKDTEVLSVKNKILEKIASLKSEINAFENRSFRPPPYYFLVVIGYFCFLRFITTGERILRLKPNAWKLALSCPRDGIVLYLVYLWNKYWWLNTATYIGDRLIEIHLLIDPSMQIHVQTNAARGWANFYIIFLNPRYLTLGGILVIFWFIVYFYFTRPEIKEKFLVK